MEFSWKNITKYHVSHSLVHYVPQLVSFFQSYMQSWGKYQLLKISLAIFWYIMILALFFLFPWQCNSRTRIACCHNHISENDICQWFCPDPYQNKWCFKAINYETALSLLMFVVLHGEHGRQSAHIWHLKHGQEHEANRSSGHKRLLELIYVNGKRC